MGEEGQRPESEHYEIRVRGHLDQRWSRWFGGLKVTHLPGGETLLAGPIVDQAALQGVLNRIGDLGLQLLLVRRATDARQSGGADERA